MKSNSETLTPHTIRAQSRVHYSYISPIPRLRAMYANPYLREKLRYRTKGTFEESKCQDVFDGQHFKELTRKVVTWNSASTSEPQHYYFDQPTDLALHLATDGIALHKHTGLDAWPLVLTLYSLAPEIRYRKEFQICCGIIPGTPRDPVTYFEMSNPNVSSAWIYQAQKKKKVAASITTPFCNPCFMT